jgi:uncharacterized protein with HEPN domain
LSSERERDRLSDIIDNIDAIGRYVGDRSFEAYAAERIVVDATERCLGRITEAVIKIGADRMAIIAPEIPVERVRGLGNLLRHEYDVLDLEQIYILIQKDLPLLRAAAAEALMATPAPPAGDS